MMDIKQCPGPTKLRHMRSRTVVGEMIRRLWRGEFVIVNARFRGATVGPEPGCVYHSTFGPPECPMPCDHDCELNAVNGCHEGHIVPWKREHQPEDCPSITHSTISVSNGATLCD